MLGLSWILIRALLGPVSFRYSLLLPGLHCTCLCLILLIKWVRWVGGVFDFAGLGLYSS